MQVYRDRGAHYALLFERGPKWVRYICNTPNGPRIERIRTAEFDAEFNLTEYPVRKAALKFLSISVRAYEYDAAAVSVLGAALIPPSPDGLTDADLAALATELAEVLGEKYHGRGDHYNAVVALSRRALSATTAQEGTASRKDAAYAQRLASLPPAAPRPKQVREPGLGAYMTDLIMSGEFTDKQIYDKARCKFVNKKVQPHYVSYYRAKLRKDGANPPEPKKGK